jgi:predicted DNA-binding transcriptional regulator YafY
MTKQTTRVLELLKRFNNGQKVCIEALQNDTLKILFMNENFYLISEVENQSFKVKISRISKIKSLEIQKETFYHNREIEKFISQMQTPLALYSEGYEEKLIEILLEVDASKIEYFKNKKHLTSQKIIEEKANGNLILSFKVTQNMEIEELIKKWIPYIKVIEPLSLKEKIEGELRKYFNA